MIIRQMSYGQTGQTDSRQQQQQQAAARKNSSAVPNRTNQQTGGASSSGFSEIAMYKLFTDSPAKKTNILKIQLSGRFTLNIIDELIVVHHRNSYSSLIFDIKMPGEFDGYTTCNYPVIKKASIQVNQSIYYLIR